VAEQRREQASEDAVMTRIAQAIMLHHGGDREEARNRFTLLWAEIGADGDALHRCTVAHHMADTQDDPADELEWDLRALAAADSLSESRVRQHHAAVSVRGFYPSLYLNLAADYEKLGRPASARAELGRARSASTVLGDDAYSTGVRSAIDRLELRLAGGAGQSS